ncbi:hypothetical protein I317_07007 [Kwoniella heveanensis CBS 569]|nr:hypothetical protein I317_07007 [Kwoniella heveanensis CBS 569]
MNALFPPDSLPTPFPYTPIERIEPVTNNVKPSNITVEENDDDDGGLVDDGAGGKRAMTKAEKQNAKKKRRKEREKAARAALEREQEIQAEAQREKERQAAEEAALPSVVQPISIINKLEDYPIPKNPRHLPLDPVEQERIRWVAQESAVEYADLVNGPISASASASASVTSSSKVQPNPSKSPSGPPSLDDRRYRHLHIQRSTNLDVINPLPAIFIGSITRVGPTKESVTPRHRSGVTMGKVNPLPVKTDHRAFPFVDLIDIDTGKHPNFASGAKSDKNNIKKARTRRGSKANKAQNYDLVSEVKARQRTNTRARARARAQARPAARFWAPPVGVGGKARGYAWGYRDSMEGRREEGAWEGYVRSKDR